MRGRLLILILLTLLSLIASCGGIEPTAFPATDAPTSVLSPATAVPATSVPTLAPATATVALAAHTPAGTALTSTVPHTATPAVAPLPTAQPATEEISIVDSGQQLGSGQSWDVALGDLDGDGDLDAFTANAIQGGAPNAVWLNDGQGTFAPGVPNPSYGQGVALGDLDGDGDLDAVVTSWWGHESSGVWLNDGSGAFEEPGQDLGPAMHPALGDLDGDGDLDLYLARLEANTVWMNDGGGTFHDSGQQLGTGISAAVAVADLDGDGDLDALAGGWEEAAKVWVNSGAGVFSEHPQSLSPASVHIHGLTLGDVDADGDQDVFMAVASGHGNQVWANDGTGVYRDSGQLLRSSLAHGVSLGDLDGDGDLDALTAHGDNRGGASGGRIWLNDGLGNFAKGASELGTASASGVALGDLNGDGSLDAFIAHGELWKDKGGEVANAVWLNETMSAASAPPAAAVLGDSWTRPSDGAAMRYVPAGSFRMGSPRDDPLAEQAEMPQRTVTLSRFWVDETEVTNAQYTRCVERGACRASRCAGNPAYNSDDYPIVGISWQDAAEFCAWAGGRLPTEAEWEYAARGQDGLVYPWGNAFDSGAVNFCDVRCENGWADATADDGYVENAPVGSFPTGASWVGALDLAGNAWEWVADWYGEYRGEAVADPAGPEDGVYKVIRGGCWANAYDGVRGAYRLDGGGEILPSFRHSNIGFRCVMDQG